MSHTDFLFQFYRQLRNHKIWGIYEFFTPSLMIADPELLKHILVKDFEHFADRRMFGDQKGSVMTQMLFNKHGEEWKNLRAVMTPTFSSGKMRNMFHLICEKADILVSFSLKKAGKNMPVDMRDMFGRFTMDTIASCAFGIECNSLSDSKPVFAKNAEKFFNIRGLRALKMAMMMCMPKLHNFLGLKVDSPEIEFFTKLSKDNVAAREKGERRGDFLDLLLEAQASEKDIHPGKKVFGEHTLVAQSVSFLMAGYDTTATALAFCAFVMAKHHQEQKRLRHEMQGLIKEYGSVTYQGIMEAKYLDAVLMVIFAESLEVLVMALEALHEEVKPLGLGFPDSRPRIPDTDVILKPGDLVQFPLWSLHHDPQYWPAAEEFKVERFLPENKDNIHSFTHMPFGMGPRSCIAMRFAVMEIKIALAQLILAADLKLAPGHEHLEFQASPFFLRPKEGVMLILTPLKKE
ncbi:Cytochrome P450 9e2 [Chionoecetes opilio]|uniref:Cytochrome P450 9e2 n=1 Tax=Chionoecetes opilio TaxID=41210 RepID=A0A8J5BSK7_CHIOP|nr:Cytochrome P450 9e2 [Chionoecetes opilio]